MKNDRAAMRPTFTRGGGGRTLQVVAISIYALAWAWLLLGLLAAGRILDAAACIATIVVMILARPQAGDPLDMVAGFAAVAAGVAWAIGGAVLVTLEGQAGGWTITASALFMMPALIGLWRSDARRGHLAPAARALGFTPICAGAALTAGVLGPISGGYGIWWLAIGLLLLIAGSVPLAVILIWSRALALPGPALVLLGAALHMLPVQSNLEVASSFDPFTALAGLVYGAGWAWTGLELLGVHGTGR